MHLAVLAKNTIAAWLLPPGLFLLLIAIGLALLSRKPRLGRGIITSSLITLTLLSTPIVANALLRLIEPPALTSIPKDIVALVCLGGGKRFAAYDQIEGETINNATLTRLRYTAQLAKQSQLPVLVSGGKPLGGISEAELMAKILVNEFNIPVRWIENESVDTQENAQFSAQLLPKGAKILLVTQAVHMPRAKIAFESVGLNVEIAPTDYANQEPFSILSLLPKSNALINSSFALHELLGLLWYKLRLNA
ncbi:YdcF family protein [Iodobacter sp.]|uniref:YdcF family protein n=1 Tax=Iodobacter sp. TaxID=1915058 RepID=UPI0025DDA0A3|nr:YdcF family protein [Iodobacter sp.]